MGDQQAHRASDEKCGVGWAAGQAVRGRGQHQRRLGLRQELTGCAWREERSSSPGFFNNKFK